MPIIDLLFLLFPMPTELSNPDSSNKLHPFLRITLPLFPFVVVPSLMQNILIWKEKHLIVRVVSILDFHFWSNNLPCIYI